MFLVLFPLIITRVRFRIPSITYVLLLGRYRALFRWVATNIRYNTAGYKSGEYGDLSAPGVLKTRTGVCSGYSRLYAQLCEEVGLEVVECSGYSKGFGYTVGEKLKVSHAWNCIPFDGKMRPLDATWGAGNVDSHFNFQFDFTEFWWATPPEQFVCVVSFYCHYEPFRFGRHPILCFSLRQLCNIADSTGGFSAQ